VAQAPLAPQLEYSVKQTHPTIQRSNHLLYRASGTNSETSST